MILQKLNDYYQRLTNSPESGIAPPGYSPQKVHFALVINKVGELVQSLDLREPDGKKKNPKMLILPEGVKRTVGIDPNFLWDNSAYVLGVEKKDEKLTVEEQRKKSERAKETFEKFKDFHKNAGMNCQDEGYLAFLEFLKKWKPENLDNIPYKDEIPGSNLVFKLEDDGNLFLHERPAIKTLWLSQKNSTVSGTFAECLVTGRKKPIARIHPPVKGVKDAQSSGAAIVSFNIDSFISYEKTQNFNAPISEEAAFAYTTALNYLLRFESRQKIQIGDATTVFWTERESPVENLFYGALDPESYADADNKQVMDFLNAARNGKKLPEIDLDVGFYILGLSPNASRIAVRFWHVSNVCDVMQKLGEHIRDMEMERNFPDKESEFPGIRKYLLETLSKNIKKDRDSKLNPLLAGAFIRSILKGEAYPIEILVKTLSVIRADIGSGEYNCGVNYYRASLIKGYLNRYYRKKGNNNWEVSMSLNTELKDPGYRLGRLFAVLEKAQEDSARPGKLNSTIKDRYFSSASTTPRSVFPILQRLSNHHTLKLPDNSRIFYEKLKQEIIDGIDAADGFKAHMNLEEQGMFMLGYYQQRKALFTSCEEK